MGGIVWGTGLALVVAVGVIVAASAWGDESGALRSFGRDLRAGLHRRRRGRAEEGLPAVRTDQAGPADDTPVDVPFAEIFAADAEPEDGYLHLDELAEMVERTGERAGRLLHQAPHRVPRRGRVSGAQVQRTRDPHA